MRIEFDGATIEGDAVGFVLSPVYSESGEHLHTLLTATLRVTSASHNQQPPSATAPLLTRPLTADPA